MPGSRYSIYVPSFSTKNRYVSTVSTTFRYVSTFSTNFWYASTFSTKIRYVATFLTVYVDYSSRWFWYFFATVHLWKRYQNFQKSARTRFWRMFRLCRPMFWLCWTDLHFNCARPIFWQYSTYASTYSIDSVFRLCSNYVSTVVDLYLDCAGSMFWLFWSKMGVSNVFDIRFKYINCQATWVNWEKVMFPFQLIFFWGFLIWKNNKTKSKSKKHPIENDFFFLVESFLLIRPETVDVKTDFWGIFGKTYFFLTRESLYFQILEDSL